MADTRTEVAIGMTDGFRYIAIRPPLDEVEIELLEGDGFMAPGGAEQVELEPKCTMISGGEYTERAQERALALGATLRLLRNNRVQVRTEPVRIFGYQSSPFRPVTN